MQGAFTQSRLHGFRQSRLHARESFVPRDGMSGSPAYIYVQAPHAWPAYLPYDNWARRTWVCDVDTPGSSADLDEFAGACEYFGVGFTHSYAPLAVPQGGDSRQRLRYLKGTVVFAGTWLTNVGSPGTAWSLTTFTLTYSWEWDKDLSIRKAVNVTLQVGAGATITLWDYAMNMATGVATETGSEAAANDWQSNLPAGGSVGYATPGNAPWGFPNPSPYGATSCSLTITQDTLVYVCSIPDSLGQTSGINFNYTSQFGISVTLSEEYTDTAYLADALDMLTMVDLNALPPRYMTDDGTWADIVWQPGNSTEIMITWAFGTVSGMAWKHRAVDVGAPVGANAFLILKLHPCSGVGAFAGSVVSKGRYWHPSDLPDEPKTCWFREEQGLPSPRTTDYVASPPVADDGADAILTGVSGATCHYRQGDFVLTPGDIEYDFGQGTLFGIYEYGAPLGLVSPHAPGTYPDNRPAVCDW